MGSWITGCLKRPRGLWKMGVGRGGGAVCLWGVMADWGVYGGVLACNDRTEVSISHSAWIYDL